MNRGKSHDANSFMLKSKVKDLEDEVNQLKQRLGDLRKAKNNTIVKREREVVQVGLPALGRAVGVEISKYKELERQLAGSEAKRNQIEEELKEKKERFKRCEEDRDEWKEKYEELEHEHFELNESNQREIERMRSQSRENGARADDVTAELERLREKLELKSMQEEHKKIENNDRESYIIDLINENAILRERVDNLCMDLSEKEARWLDNKEKVTKKLQEKWDEKYAKWMSETENKIEELRKANLYLKSCLYKGVPRDSKTTNHEEVGTSQSTAPPDGDVS